MTATKKQETDTFFMTGGGISEREDELESSQNTPFRRNPGAV